MVITTWRKTLSALAVLGLILWSMPAAAQVATGDVAGTVKDAQGGVMTQYKEKSHG